jgi:hypothetical protein
VLFDLLLDVADNLENVTGFRATTVENKVGMTLGNLGTPNLVAFETHLFDEPGGGVGFGVAEDTATTREVIGLRSPSLFQVL